VKNNFCISVAKKPGKFGEIVHNTGYKALGLNFQYKAFYSNDISGVIKGVRALGIRGCSVSMPFKESVIPYLDNLEPLAKKIGAVNTIVNRNNRLIGYNTDFYGAKECLKRMSIKQNSSILLLGSGGVSRAILTAIKQMKIKNCTISSRNTKKAKLIAKKFNIDRIDWKLREKNDAKILINATPIGMYPGIYKSPVSVYALPL
jgi:shikimate dehydrogenase